MSKLQLRLCILTAAACPPAAAVSLYQFDPSDSQSIFPPCMLHWLTGLHCPCCGSTRCGHALAHGDLWQALAWNPLTVPLFLLFIPWLYWYLLATVLRRPLPLFTAPNWLARLCLIGLIAFGIVRNLPFWPFELLAPHKL